MSKVIRYHKESRIRSLLVVGIIAFLIYGCTEGQKERHLDEEWKEWIKKVDWTYSICIADREGENIQPIFSIRCPDDFYSYEDQPYWLSDREIAFLAHLGNKHGLWTVDEKGKLREILSLKGEGPLPPGGGPAIMAVSPDGKEIVLGTGEFKGGIWLWIINSKGTNLRKLKLKWKKGTTYGLSWSPDGKTIVWRIGSQKEGGNPMLEGGNLWAIDRDGKNLRELYSKGDIILNSSHASFNWSPDGRLVVFYPKRMAKRILAADVKTNEIKELVDESFFSGAKELTGRCQPAFSPDGKKIIFLRVRPTKRDIVLCEFDLEKKESRILNLLKGINMGTRRNISYSSDGEKIVLEFCNQEGFLNIVSLNSDGSGLKELTKDVKGSSWGHAWSPDGKKIAFFSGYVFLRKPKEKEK
ncbi:MAG: hypothetical protein AB1797_09770 [bacterium]